MTMSCSALALAILLGATAVFNHQLCVALLPLVLSLLLLRPAVGLPAAILIGAFFTSAAAVIHGACSVPWVPTPEADMEALLERLELRERSTFLELGSGDGRNLIRAVNAGFSTAVGMELSPLLVAATRLRVWWLGLSSRVSVAHADVLNAALPPKAPRAVYFYMSVEVARLLAPRLACAYGDRGNETSVFSRDFELPLPFSLPRERLSRGRTSLLVYDMPPRPMTCR